MYHISNVCVILKSCYRGNYIFFNCAINCIGNDNENLKKALPWIKEAHISIIDGMLIDAMSTLLPALQPFRPSAVLMTMGTCGINIVKCQLGRLEILACFVINYNIFCFLSVSLTKWVWKILVLMFLMVFFCCCCFFVVPSDTPDKT